MAVRKSENTTLNGHSSHSVIHGHVFRSHGKATKRLTRKLCYSKDDRAMRAS